MKRRGVWKQWPVKQVMSRAMRSDGLIWDIWAWINGMTCARTVEDVSLRYNISKGKARRRLEALYKYGYLSKKRQSFWNGMHYADKDFYW